MGPARGSFARTMRLGLLGPAGGDVEALEQGARILLERERASRVVYLGIDGALDRLVLDWAKRLVGDDPSDEALFQRATASCADALPAAIDAFVAKERARERLKALECLPRASARAIEKLHERTTLLLYDKTKLEEDELETASLVVYGRSAEPVVLKEGPKIHVSPGALGSRGGVALIESHRDSGELRIAIFDRAGTLALSEKVSGEAASKASGRSA